MQQPLCRASGRGLPGLDDARDWDGPWRQEDRDCPVEHPFHRPRLVGCAGTPQRPPLGGLM